MAAPRLARSTSSASGATTIGTATAQRHVVGYGSRVTVNLTATGDDVALVGSGSGSPVSAAGATLTAGGPGTLDLDPANDAGSLSHSTLFQPIAISGYANGLPQLALASTTLVSPLTGNALKMFSGSNVVLTGGFVTTSLGTATATRDIRVEAGGAATLGQMIAARELIAAAGLSGTADLTVGALLQAGDDVVLTSTRDILATGTTIRTQSSGGFADTQTLDITAAKRADGTDLAYPGGGTVQRLVGSNVTIVAARDAVVGTVTTATSASGRDVRIEAGHSLTAGPVTASRNAMLLAGLTIPGTLTTGTTVQAGDDILLVNRSGDVVANATALTVTGTGPDTQAMLAAPFYDDSLGALRANGLAVANPTVGGGNITRLGGSNIVVAASGNATVGTATATAGFGRDIRIAAGGTATLARFSQRRGLAMCCCSAPPPHRPVRRSPPGTMRSSWRAAARPASA